MLIPRSPPASTAEAPSMEDIGKCAVQLCYKIGWDVIVVQEFAAHLDLTDLNVKSPAINSSLAADGELSGPLTA